MCPFQEGQRDRARGLQSSSAVGAPKHALISVGNQDRGPLRRGGLTDPEGPVVPAWAGVTAEDYVAATDQVAQGTEVPTPRGEPRGDGTSAEARVLCRSVPGGRKGCLDPTLESRASTDDQVHLVDAHRSEHPAGEGGLEKEGRNR